MNRIKELRCQNKLSQAKLAEALNVHQTAVSQWEKGRTTPDFEIANKLAQYFNCSIDYLLGFSDSAVNMPKKSKGVKIPVLGSVVAGIPIEAIEEILDYEDITPEMASTGEFFALRINGDSMEPKISEGDVVIVRRQEDAETGDTIIALVNGNEATVKKLKKRPEGIMLIPTNQSYEPMFYTKKEIEDLPVRILGKVVELRAKF